eukprot:3304681-Prymnesium_polylepis.1
MFTTRGTVAAVFSLSSQAWANWLLTGDQQDMQHARGTGFAVQVVQCVDQASAASTPRVCSVPVP